MFITYNKLTSSPEALWTFGVNILELIVLPRIFTIPMQGSHRSLKTWNLNIWIPGLESPGIFVAVIESWNLVLSIQEFSRYTSEIWVYRCTLKVHEFIERVLEFDIGRSWNLIRQNVYEPCYETWQLNNQIHKYNTLVQPSSVQASTIYFG